jgi:hypothetical protein
MDRPDDQEEQEKAGDAQRGTRVQPGWADLSDRG